MIIFPQQNTNSEILCTSNIAEQAIGYNYDCILHYYGVSLWVHYYNYRPSSIHCIEAEDTCGWSSLRRSRHPSLLEAVCLRIVENVFEMCVTQ